MANVYHTDSDKEAVVDFVKDSKELYDNIDEHVEEKARKEFLWEQFAKSRKLSVKVCKTWFGLTKDTLWEADPVKVWTGP